MGHREIAPSWQLFASAAFKHPRRAIFLTILSAAVLLPASGAAATTLPTTISKNTTLTKASNPYTTSGTTVAGGVTLKIEPGVEIRNANLTIKGTLEAQGTATERVIFGEGTSAGIKLEAGSGASVINYAEFKKVGEAGYSRVAVQVSKVSPKITNSVFRNCALWNIWVPEGGSPEIAGNRFISPERSAIYYTAGAGITGLINIHDNVVEGGQSESGIYVNAEGSKVTSKTLGHNTVSGSQAIYSSAIEYGGPDIPVDISENTLTSNTINTISVNGPLLHEATWKKGATLQLYTVTVASGVTLHITAGAQIKNPNLVVKGTLDAQGTATEPVVFSEGRNAGIKLEAGGGASVINYAEFKEVGENYWTRVAVQVSKVSPKITNSVFRNCGFWNIWVPEGGSPEIANDRFFNPERSAVYYRAEAGATGLVNIHDNFVEGGHTDAAITVNVEGSKVTSKTLGHNTIIGLEAIYASAIEYLGSDIPIDIGENTLTANKVNMISVDGTLAHEATWKKGATLQVIGAVTVPSGITLHIAAGAQIRNPNLVIKGTLDAQGTAAEPMVFSEGRSSGIKFEAGGGASVINYAEFKKVGEAYWTRAPIQVSKVSPKITNSVFRNCGFWNVWVPEGGSPEIANDRFLNPERAAVYYSTEAASTGTINIHDNFVEGGHTDAAITVNAEGSSVTSTTLGRNRIINSAAVYAAALSYSGPDIPADVTTTVVESNYNNYISLNGTVSKTGTWAGVGSPIDVGSIKVASGAILRISPGTVLFPGEFRVNGGIEAIGSAEEPIQMTTPYSSKGQQWNGVDLSASTKPSTFRYVEIANAKTGILFGTPKVIVEKSTLRTNALALQVPSGSPQIEYNRFRGNTVGLEYQATSTTLKVPNNDWGCSGSQPKPKGCGDEVVGKVSWTPVAVFAELPIWCSGKAKPALNMTCLFERFEPEIHYDGHEQYGADSVAGITDNWGDTENGLFGENRSADPYSNALYDGDSERQSPNFGLLAESDPRATFFPFHLTLDSLGKSYPNGQTADSNDWLDEFGEYERDAHNLERAGYDNRVYGYPVAAGSETWLEYWYWYYYDSKTVDGFGSHEGDWEAVLVKIDSQGQLKQVVLSQHDHSAKCTASEITRSEDGHPIVYVGGGSHANYPKAGYYSIANGNSSESADGGEGPARPAIEYLTATTPKWVTWPGHWGNSRAEVEPIESSSPTGPAFHEAWTNPSAYFSGSGACEENFITEPFRSAAAIGSSEGRVRSAKAGPSNVVVDVSLPGVKGDGEWPKVVASVDEKEDGGILATNGQAVVGGERAKVLVPVSIKPGREFVVRVRLYPKNGRPTDLPVFSGKR